MTDQAPPRISLVIPCKDEARRLPATLAALQPFLAAREGIEVILAVEKSSDGTERLAEEAAAANPAFVPLCSPVARGKGFAVKRGMLAARGGIVFFMDADLSVPLRFVDEFLPWFDRADVVFGSRKHHETVITRSQPADRVFLGRMFNWALRLTGSTPFKDTQCGFKAFTREAAQAVFAETELNGFAFDVEVLAIAEAKGFRLVDRPVEWADAPGTKVRPWRDGIRAVKEGILAARRARRENPRSP